MSGYPQILNCGRVHGAVQSLVEQQVRAFAHFAPFGEAAGGHAALFAFLVGVDVLRANGTVRIRSRLRKRLLDLAQQVGLDGEMAEGVVARVQPPVHLGLHVGAVEAVEGVALDRHRLDVLAAENLIEGMLDRAGARLPRSRRPR